MKNINEQDKDGHTVLMLTAFWEGNKKIKIKELLKNPKINVNLQDNWGKTALMYAMYINSTNVALQLLKHKNINVNLQTKQGDTALITAIVYDRIEIVKALLKHPGINVNSQTKNGNTALTIAKHFERLEIVKLLQNFMNQKEN